MVSTRRCRTNVITPYGGLPEVGARAQQPNENGNETAASAPLFRSVLLTGPHRHMDGFQGVVHGCGQVIPDCIQVRGVFQAGRECGDGLVGVVPVTVEPPVHHPLHPPPQWIEKRHGGQRGCGHRYRGAERQDLSGQQDQGAYSPISRPVTMA